jgi:hypothetical protein
VESIFYNFVHTCEANFVASDRALYIFLLAILEQFLSKERSTLLAHSFPNFMRLTSEYYFFNIVAELHHFYSALALSYNFDTASALAIILVVSQLLRMNKSLR